MEQGVVSSKVLSCAEKNELKIWQGIVRIAGYNSERTAPPL
jgi:hypothetical protein